MLPRAADRLANVNIRPGPSILSVLKHLNYKPWFALAEFVDNSLQSFLSNQAQLQDAVGGACRLDVEIVLDSAAPGRIIIRDNAAGISARDFPRAFRAAMIPSDVSGLSEFGMGMKSAACWLAGRWHVRTKSLGERVERTVEFDVAQIVRDELEELRIEEVAAASDTHFTEVILDNLNHIPIGRTVRKIKEHLADIYRVFVRAGTLKLTFDGEPLVYREPNILTASYERDPKGELKYWKKDIHFELGGGQIVTGFAALRDPGSFAHSGFSLFRRNRLIQGSGEEGYRPPLISGNRHLRLFGELHLEGFDVSHTKDGFRWDDNEEPFFELLKDHLDSEELPLLRQCDLFRSLAPRKDRARAAEAALKRTTGALESQVAEVLPRVAAEPLAETREKPLESGSLLATREFRFDFRGNPWIIKVELSDDPATGDWLSLSDQPASISTPHTLEIRVSMAHPFMVSFAQTDSDDIEALLRVAAALALAETLARQSGIRYAGTIRRNVNEILRQALSRPVE